jgi:transcriptional regulator with XRE-family HTH domain
MCVPDLTQREFARLCGLKPTAWNAAERGRRRIGSESAIKLWESTGATLAYIYLDEPGALPTELRREIRKIKKADQASNLRVPNMPSAVARPMQ